MSNKPTDWSNASTASTPLRAGVAQPKQSLCAYKGRSRRASIKYTKTTNVGNKKSSRIWFRAVRLGSAENHSEGGGGDKRTFSFWLPFGDQNECCIGSVTKTLKVIHDPGFKRPAALPRRKAGGGGGLKLR